MEGEWSASALIRANATWAASKLPSLALSNDEVGAHSGWVLGTERSFCLMHSTGVVAWRRLIRSLDGPHQRTGGATRGEA